MDLGGIKLNELIDVAMQSERDHSMAIYRLMTAESCFDALQQWPRLCMFCVITLRYQKIFEMATGHSGHLGQSEHLAHACL